MELIVEFLCNKNILLNIYKFWGFFKFIIKINYNLYNCINESNNNSFYFFYYLFLYILQKNLVYL
jgi:hypothetical protein